jgi:hypothetical protein
MDKEQARKHHPEDTLKDELDFLEEFARAWRMLVSPDVPSVLQLRRWYMLHDPLRMLATLNHVAAKAERMEQAKETFTADHQIRIFSSIANHLKTNEQGKHHDHKSR